MRQKGCSPVKSRLQYDEKDLLLTQILCDGANRLEIVLTHTDLLNFAFGNHGHQIAPSKKNRGRKGRSVVDSIETTKRGAKMKAHLPKSPP